MNKKGSRRSRRHHNRLASVSKPSSVDKVTFTNATYYGKKYRLSIDRNTYTIWCDVVTEASAETRWLTLVEVDETDDAINLKLHGEVYFPPQVVSPTSVDVDAQKQATFNETLFDQGVDINSLKCETHSHVNMEVIPSDVDQNHLAEMPKIHRKGIVVRCIFNKKHELSITVLDIDRKIAVDLSGYTILPSSVSASSLERMKENVKEAPAYTGYGRNSFNQYGGYTQQRKVDGVNILDFHLDELAKKYTLGEICSNEAIIAQFGHEEIAEWYGLCDTIEDLKETLTQEGIELVYEIMEEEKE